MPMIFNSLLQKTGCHCYCLVDKVGGRCIFAFELTQSYISRNPLIWNKLNSRGTTGINTSNMTFQVQHCQVHLCIFPPFPGKKEKFCRWPPKNWRRQQVVSEIYPCLNPTTPICPAQYCFFFFFFFTPLFYWKILCLPHLHYVQQILRKQSFYMAQKNVCNIKRPETVDWPLPKRLDQT